jgi:hypothetical protein
MALLFFLSFILVVVGAVGTSVVLATAALSAEIGPPTGEKTAARPARARTPKPVFLGVLWKPVCGHPWPGDLQLGREEGCECVTIDGVQYYAHVEWGSCSECNTQQRARVLEMAKKKAAERKGVRMRARGQLECAQKM